MNNYDYKKLKKENLKVTALVEANIKYVGNPTVEKGVIIGSAMISKI